MKLVLKKAVSLGDRKSKCQIMIEEKSIRFVSSPSLVELTCVDALFAIDTLIFSRGGGGTPLYGLYRYVQRQRV